MDSHRTAAWLSLCWLALAASPASAQENYAGTWVMKAGERNFIVLTLRNKDGNFAGSLSRPAHFQSGDGLSFTQISAGVTVEPIVAASIQKAHLRLVVANPKDPSDREEYDVALSNINHASLRPVGVPFDAWKLERSASGAPPAVSTDWDPRRVYSTVKEIRVSSTEMRTIYEEDQKPRQHPEKLTPADWRIIEKRDEERKNQTRALLAAGSLHTGEDYRKASFLFQHGGGPDDYLVAHTLAMIAIAKGDSTALWIAAATLDRFLNSSGKAQIFGTQFYTKPGEAATQEPYDRGLISDALRRELGVPAISKQQEGLKQ